MATADVPPGFRRQVRAALARLYDPLALRREPLAARLSCTGAHAGYALRERLLTALADLKPDSAVNGAARAWQIYRVLQLRYVEAHDAAAVQRQLSLGKSQYYRDHELALDTLASLLWQDVSPSSEPLADAAGLARQPAELGALIGRERELRATLDRLRDPDVRLLTLTGPGGIGKTRLALSLVEQLGPEFPGEVHFVDITPIRDAALVLPTLGKALGVWDTGPRPLSSLAAYIADRRLLVVLDNCEQVLDAASELGELLAACSGLKLLATSREPLHLTWEHALLLRPLGLPDSRAATSANEVGRAPAVELFLNRVRRLQPDFELTDANASTVAQVCTRLDGMPLALELAAARISLLPPSAMLARLASSGGELALLSGGYRDAPERHRTMRAAIAWSHDLLGCREQTVFRRLSIFVGGFSIDAAQAVCDPCHELAWDIFDVVSLLADKSLLVPAGATESGARFKLPEPIRAFAAEQLQSAGEAETFAEVHARYFSARGQANPTAFEGPDCAQWLDAAEADLDNFRAASEWCFRHGFWHEGLSVFGSGNWIMLFNCRGYIREGISRLQAMLAHAGDDDPARPMALMGVAWLALLNGQYELSHAMGERAVAASRAKGDAAELALILNLHLQDEIQALADPATTRPMAAEALTLSHAAGEPARIAIAHFALGCIALQEGDQTTAEQHLQILEDITRTSDVVYLLPFALHNLGLIAWRQGNHAQALDRQCEALDLRLQQRDKRGVALSLESLGWLAGSIGQERRAVRLLAAAERTREAIGVQVLRFRRTDHDAALASARRSLSPEELAAEWQTGSAFTLDEAVAEALALRSVPPPAAQAPPTALTERELEVAFAVAEGLTNSRIAARLVISPRTVDRHLENIMRKLDIGSRAQLAAWVASRSNG